MNQRELARLVEISEARAYASLMQCRSTDLAEGDFGVVRVGSAWAMISPAVTGTLNFNRVIGLGLEQPAEPSDLDELARLYSEHELSFAVELGPHARPSDLPAWLRERRIRRGMPTAMYYRDALPMAPGPGSVVVSRAGSAAECAQVADICSEVFRMPAVVQGLLAATRSDSRWRQWLVRAGPEPIAAALSFVDEQVAWLGWDATLPQHRGLGAHSALIVARVNDAHASGCRHLTTETAVHTAAIADPSGRNYEKLGFLLAQNRPTYVAIRPLSSASALRK